MFIFFDVKTHNELIAGGWVQNFKLKLLRSEIQEENTGGEPEAAY